MAAQNSNFVPVRNPLPPADWHSERGCHEGGDPAFLFLSILYEYTGMPFRCRLCSSDLYDPVAVRRPNGTVYQSSLLACRGCSAVFTDAARFSKPPDPATRQVIAPQSWESRRTSARRERLIRG